MNEFNKSQIKTNVTFNNYNKNSINQFNSKFKNSDSSDNL